MEVLLANPRGFCAGVERAVRAVEAVIEARGGPVHVRHEIVHNRQVVERLRGLGARFVETTGEIPEGEVAVLSAHGVPPSVLAEAEARNLTVIDATCPLVVRVQLEVARQAQAGRSVIVIGHRGHVEVEGLKGYFPADADGIVAVVGTVEEAAQVTVPNPARVAWVTQTTLAVSEARRIVEHLRARFPELVDPRGETICYATQNRQDAVRALAESCDAIVVLGAPHSSNSNRLAEVARECGVRALLIETPDELDPAWFDAKERVGLTASASAPETLVEATVGWFGRHFPGTRFASMGEAEDIHFNLPNSIRKLGKEADGMNEVKSDTKSVSIDDLAESTADVARRLRSAAEDAGDFAGDQVARVVKVASSLRDRTFSEKRLESARQKATVVTLRKSAHEALDVGIDFAAVAVESAFDAVDLLLRRKEPAPAPAPAPG